VPVGEHSEEWDRLRDKIAELAISRGEYGGYPLPDDTVPLVMEPRFPLTTMNGAVVTRQEDRKESPTLEMMARAAKLFDFASGDIKPLGHWWSEAARGEVWLYLNGDGKLKCTVIKKSEDDVHAHQLLETLGCSRNWSVKAEEMALGKLRDITKPHQYRDYVLTGTFIERSPRSQVLYMFRRCAPTIAIRHAEDGTLRVLAKLCGHPIGYYEGTFAGAMVPTDDVIAALLCMRGDEVFLWRKCNQTRRDG